MEGGLDVSDGSSEQESIPDSLSFENVLQSDISDMSSETDDGETQHDSYERRKKSQANKVERPNSNI